MTSLSRVLPLICFFLCVLPCLSAVEDNFSKDFAAYMRMTPNPLASPNYFIYQTLFDSENFRDGNNASCIICTILVGMSLQVADIHKVNIDDFIMNDLCDLFPDEIKPACQELVKNFGPIIIQALTETSSPDEVCLKVKSCLYPECKLFVNMTPPAVSLSPDWTRYIEPGFYIPEYFGVKFSPFAELIKLVQEILNTLVPMDDVDGDRHSPKMAEVRGYNWRGRDCDDTDPKVYPGRKVDPYGGEATDFNCNGISGTDPTTGKDYKDLFCTESGQMGVLLLGDSAGIFAQIPNELATAADWNKTTFAEIWPTVLNQGGHPQFSAYTGYEDIGMLNQSVHAVYKNLYERNKCNFRDYQNLAVSGAASGGTLDNAKYVNRNQTTDFPLLVIMELAANDVCFGDTTSPDDFRQNILNILNWLDTVVPAGSHFLSIGLVNGSIIHQITGNRHHPMGMPYNAFYDYLNCLGIDLCENYLTSNLTRINWTAEKAAGLNQVYLDIFSNYTAKNFDFIHYDFPAQEIIDTWTAQGGDPFDLISHVDGFHPSQNFNMLLGDYLWTALSRDKPDWLGVENPNNTQIESLFGNQGGY